VSGSLEARRNSLPSCRAGSFSPPESFCFAAGKAGIQLRFGFVDQHLLEDVTIEPLGEKQDALLLARRTEELHLQEYARIAW